jgi:hypothetical protein
MKPTYTSRPLSILDATYRAPFIFPVLGDVNGDGHADLLVLGQQYPLTSGVNGTNWQAQPGRLFLGDGKGGFTPAPVALFPVDGLRTVHAREVIFSDFNGDGRNDVFVADTGWDAEPFPGQPNLLFLSTPQGGWRDASASLPRVSDFTHSAAAADIDADGDVDLFVGNGYNNSGDAATAAYLLLNDGSGNFVRNDTNVPVTAGQELHIFAPGRRINHFAGSTFSDLNGDGRPDLIVTADASNTFDAFRQTTIFWNVEGRFESARSTKLPEVVGTPPHIDMDTAFADFDGDGLKDIVLIGTNGQPFYDGAYVQVLRSLGNEQFEDISAAVLPSDARNLTQPGVSTGNPWPIWVRTSDFNGDGAPDFLIDYNGAPLKDSTPVLWLNDGMGRFSVVTASAFRPDSEHWQVDSGQWFVTPQGLQIVTVQIYEGSGGLLATGRSATTPWFGRPNDPGNETVIGGTGNDRLVGGVGNDNINGGAGIDSAAFQLPRAQYMVSNSGQGVYTVTASSGNESTDTLQNIERLKFSDVNVAMDVGATQSSGQTALLMGAVLPGRLYLDASKQALLGSVISLFDQGFTLQQLSGAVMRLPIWDVLTGKANSSNTDIATYLLTNVNHAAPSAATLASAVSALDLQTSISSGQGDFLWKLAESDANQIHVELVGLSTSGLVFIPPQ